MVEVPLVDGDGCGGSGDADAIEARPSVERVMMLRLPQMADRREPAHSLAWNTVIARFGKVEG